jgi:nucleotide-binding universal stress UspA family protein
MDKRILLGVDADLSPISQHALRAAGSLFAQSAPRISLIVLTVIPVMQAVTTNPGVYVGQALPFAITPQQRKQAEELTSKACALLEQQGVELKSIQSVVRVGLPAEEIVKVAQELHVDLIIVGSRGNTFKEKLRRFFFGSTSRRVLEIAPCPVMIVARSTPLHMSRPSNLVTWYERAVMNYLQEYPQSLTVFTPQQVAQRFMPPKMRQPGRREIAAATLALEHLVSNGILCRRDIKGELLYVND